MTRFLTASILFVGLASAATAQPADRDLEKKVRAVLQANCYRCHSHQAARSKGGLMVDSRALMVRGGASGPAIVPGQPERSMLIKAVRQQDDKLMMPPKGKLDDADIALLSEWIKAGAPWTEAPVKQVVRAPGKITDADRAWWSFQPVKAGQVPPGDSNPIDRFIRARLKHEGLLPAPPAEPRALIRRMTFDVIGLPPSPEEVEAFVQECSEGRQRATEKLIDRLLASPHYGERWGRHWLDVVRFAESDGYRLDSFRPQAWRYRDYVIKSFNDDKPYDQFVREQLAGDELFPGNLEGLVAIGFLTHGIYEFNQRDVRTQWDSILSETVDVTGEVFLGLSVGCARCHDHKFDPILQKDYYTLRAFFEGLLPSEAVPLATAAQKAEHARKLAIWQRETAGIRAAIEAIEGPERAKVAAVMSSKFPTEIQQMLKKPRAERSPREEQLALLAHRQLLLEYEKLDARFKGEAKARLLQFRKDLARFDADKPAPLPLCQSVREVGKIPPPTFVPRKKTAVQPGFPVVLDQPAPSIVPPIHQATSGRRAALARWLTRPDHPLTSRVMVNRIWQQHFGRGIVGTASDFGNLGDRPTHPELLDWLTRRFIDDGWSIKKLHRLVLTSRTYQQSVRPGAEALKKDPENRLLSRMTTRRLDAEQIRDAVLAINGKLDRRGGGPSVELKEPRRSIYLKIMRNSRDPILDVFDVPDGFSSTARRNVTITSTQALLMLNSPMMVQQAGVLAERLHKLESTDQQRIDRAFRLAFGRGPSAKDVQTVQSFLSEQRKLVTPSKDRTPPVDPRRAAWIDFCQVLLNANEFLYVD